jgi:hypothetical protein
MFLLSFCQVYVVLGVFLIPPSFSPVNAQPADNAATVYLALFEQLPKPEALTDEQREALSNWKDADLDGNAAKVVALYQPAFS